MKKKKLWALTICLLFITTVLHAAPPSVGQKWPDIKLIVPQNKSYIKYLGLTGVKNQKFFSLSQIKANAIIVEIFSMYCIYCQKEAPKVNQLYYKIVKDPKLCQKIKIIGIGTGNTPLEVEVFKKKYNVPFPLFNDPDFKVFTTLGRVRTPYFFVITKDGIIRYTHVGEFGTVDEFLNEIIKALDWK